MSPDDQSIIVAAYQQRQYGVSPPSSSFYDRRMALAKALKRAKAIQAAERLRLGPRYIGGGEHVVVDDAGRPSHADTISDFWREL